MTVPHPYTLACTTLALALSLSTPLQAEDDWLDRIDQQFEQTFEKTDAAFDQAMRDGVRELDNELSKIWGQSRQLPEPKVWVGYSQDRRTRIVVDYEKGEMSLEGFDQDRSKLTREFQDILLDDSEALNERAALRRKLIEKTRRFKDDSDKWDEWEDSDTYVARPRQPRPRMERAPVPEAKKGIPPTKLRDTAKRDTSIKWQQRRELSQLVAPQVRPKFVTRKVALQNGQATLSRLTIPLRKDRDRLSAQTLRHPVRTVAEKYDLPQSLILSVIKNESSFNPRARSHANALGLMQLVPTSGGKEAYSYLKGKEATPGADVLYDPHKNILLGATYLHLLNTRYFGKVKDDLARRYLIISAYNTGAGNVAKAFTGAMKLSPAIRRINTMTAQQIYNHLQKNLPYAETKTYLARVAKDTRTFARWDTARTLIGTPTRGS